MPFERDSGWQFLNAGPESAEEVLSMDVGFLCAR